MEGGVGHTQVMFMPSSGILTTPYHSVTVFPTKTYPLVLHRSASSSSNSRREDFCVGNVNGQGLSRCKCVIDLSTPATLERDFYAWLNGIGPSISRNTACCSSHSEGACSTSTSPSSRGLDSSSISSSISPTTSTDCYVGGSGVGESSSMGMNTVNGSYLKPRARRKRNITKGRGTNLYGRQYCPGRPLSIEERSQIISLFHAGMKVNAIAKQLCISHGCVSKIITRFRETGLLLPNSHTECRRRKRLLQQIKLENG